MTFDQILTMNTFNNIYPAFLFAVVIFFQPNFTWQHVAILFILLLLRQNPK